MRIEDITFEIDDKINYCYQQSRGWADVGNDYHKSEIYWRLAKWFEIRRRKALKNIFGI